MLEAMLISATRKEGLPGPATLAAGDTNAGYYGLTQSYEFITGSQLAALVGLSAGTLMNDTTAWMKFAYQGKVLYIPQKPIRNGLNWDAYNALNLVKPGALVTILGFQFIVRHMTGGNADPATAAGGEWNALIYPVYTSVGTWAKYTSADLGIVAGTGGATYCQEVHSGSAPYHVYRGYSAYNYFFHDASNSTLTNYGWRPVLEYVPPA